MYNYMFGEENEPNDNNWPRGCAPPGGMNRRTGNYLCLFLSAEINTRFAADRPNVVLAFFLVNQRNTSVGERVEGTERRKQEKTLYF